MSAPAESLRVNGIARPLSEVPHEERLLDTLRWRFGLNATKEGCRTGDCGACTVLVNGLPTLSCLALTHELAGAEVLTVEAVASDPIGLQVQEAFRAAEALQCGYCTPGFVVALTGLLREKPDASVAELREGLQGNLCRCTGYAAIDRAVTRLAERPR